MIYLDNNATTRPTPAACDAVRRGLEGAWANPSSVHRAGQAARHAVELARQSLAELIHAKPRDIILTSSGTESIDLAIRGVLSARGSAAALVTTRVEHAAVRDLAEDLERSGRTVHWVPLAEAGQVDLAALGRLLASKPALVSIQWANNETGAIQPVDAIRDLCQAAGVLFHCDATQWVGKEPCPPAGPPADLLTFSPHKFHGPKGVGVLWTRPGVRFRPVIHGTQELGRRGGTENVPGILGGGVAADQARAWLQSPAERARLATLRDRFERRVLADVPDAVINAAAARLWNTTNIGVPRLEAEALLLLLSERGVCVSAGAACSSGSLDPSPVLLAMGVPPVIAHGSLRFSLCRDTTPDEIDSAAAAFIDAVRILRASG